MISDSIPAFLGGVRDRFDAACAPWVALIPKRACLLEDASSAIDGSRTAREIAAGLAARFDARLAVIEADVLEMLNDLSARGVVQDRGPAA